MKTDDTKGVHKTGHGGKRIAGAGKKIGRPAEKLETNPKGYLDMLDDETIQALKKVHPIRSTAIRILAKQFKG
jgi:hypothetical protein